MQQIPFDQRDGYIWFDGEMVDARQAKLHVLSHGLNYGTTVFEGLRIYSGTPFKLREHMERLHHSANVLGFKIPYTVEQLCEEAWNVTRANNLQMGYIRPLAWRGTETMVIDGNGTTIHTAIAAWPTMSHIRSEQRDRGITLTVSNWRKPAANASPYNTKAVSIYTLSSIVKTQANNQGFDDGIMLDSHGNVCEGSTSNIFFIFGQELHTPIPDCFLNGITRQTVITLARELGIKVVERYIKQEEMQKADGCFLTGTAIEIMPISLIDDLQFDKSHPMITLLHDTFHKYAHNPK